MWLCTTPLLAGVGVWLTLECCEPLAAVPTVFTLNADEVDILFENRTRAPPALVPVELADDTDILLGDLLLLLPPKPSSLPAAAYGCNGADEDEDDLGSGKGPEGGGVSLLGCCHRIVELRLVLVLLPLVDTRGSPSPFRCSSIAKEESGGVPKANRPSPTALEEDEGSVSTRS